MIETSWGPLEVDEEQIYHFPKGIPGFEEEKRFVLISNQEEPFQYLQSLQEKYLSFLIADPFLFYPDYEFELPDPDSKELKIEDEMLIRCMITLRDPVETSTMNLLAPLVLNPKLQLGKQIVLHASAYSTKQKLWDSSGNTKGEEKEDAGTFTQKG
ncbi:flagellar assembly protein FliW [Paenibacillus sp. FSL W8-0194]|uniref:flagellar assembly protein FliW n=1 Tax=Paenibacillus sp. FSL W8-0194 TaxID=2921711 RepID=UPI0030DDA626